MKRAIALVILTLLIAGFAFAADTDDFTITVTVNYVDFSLKNAGNTADYNEWPIGNVNAGASSEMTTGTGGDHVYVNNGSNLLLDFKAYSTSAAPTCAFGTPTAWSPADPAGTDTYKLELGKGGLDAVPTSYTTILGTDTGSSNLFYSTVSAGESYHLYAKLGVPTVASDGCEHEIVVYILGIVP